MTVIYHVRGIQRSLPLTRWEDETRRAFGLGNAGPNAGSRES